MPTQTVCLYLCVATTVCWIRLLNHSKFAFVLLLFWICLWKYNSSQVCSTVPHTRLFSGTHTRCQSRQWYMQTLLLSLSLNLLSGVRHIIVFMAHCIHTEIFHLHILWKSHLFSTAICKYSTMNLVNRMNHSVFAGCST